MDRITPMEAERRWPGCSIWGLRSVWRTRSGHLIAIDATGRAVIWEPAAGLWCSIWHVAPSGRAFQVAGRSWMARQLEWQLEESGAMRYLEEIRRKSGG